MRIQSLNFVTSFKHMRFPIHQEKMMKMNMTKIMVCNTIYTVIKEYNSMIPYITIIELITIIHN